MSSTETPPALIHLAPASGGIEDPDKPGAFIFPGGGEAALRVCRALGWSTVPPVWMLSRDWRLSAAKAGALLVEVERVRDDYDSVAGWLPGKRSNRGWWRRLTDVLADQRALADRLAQIDDQIRALSSEDGQRAGWSVRVDSAWEQVPKDDVKSALLGLGRTKAEADVILGTAVLSPWRLVSLPFQSEYPGGRQWNRDAAQYRYAPAELADGEAPHHPHWDLILRHCFGDLDAPLRASEWGQRNNIRSGRDYGLAWIACMLRDPFAPLPYLFLHGPQNSGKSILHEAISLLVTKGVASADRALTNNNDFNGELAGAILATVEETNLTRCSHAYDRMKDWVTSPTLWIRRMRTDSYSLPNSLHFIQAANDRSYCPIAIGDTRVVMMFVPEIEDEIPKPVLLDRLAGEAPAFMASVMGMDFPSIEGRLRLPVVTTYSKQRAEELSRSPIERFIAERCTIAKDTSIAKSKLANAYKAWCAEQGEQFPGPSKFGRQLLGAYPDVSAGRASRAEGQAPTYTGIALAA